MSVVCDYDGASICLYIYIGIYVYVRVYLIISICMYTWRDAATVEPGNNGFGS